MLPAPISIGPISLQSFEVPASVRFGGRQRLVVHRLARGQRLVECLGPDDDDISFQGFFIGPDAATRALQLDAVRTAGAVVSLTWESFQRHVVIKRFVADYRSPSLIPYSVLCTVVGNDTTSLSPSAAQLIQTDLIMLLTASASTGIDLRGLQSALSTTNILVTGTSDNLAASAAATAVTSAATIAISSLDATIAVSAPSSDALEQFSDTFGTTVSSAGTLAASVVTQSYAGRIAATLGGVT